MKKPGLKFQKWEAVDKEKMMLSNFTKSDNEIMRAICYEVAPQAYPIYMAVLSHRNHVNNECYPPRQLIAKECNLSLRQTDRYLQLLCTAGFIKVNSGKSGLANNYYFPFEDEYEESAQASLAYKRNKGFKALKKNNKNSNVNNDGIDDTNNIEDEEYDDSIDLNDDALEEPLEGEPIDEEFEF